MVILYCDCELPKFVYVNRKSVRRLDFLQKAINAAFAPCLALLRGRDGADGQGVVRRMRNPNASSGQRQVISTKLSLGRDRRFYKTEKVLADGDFWGR